MTMLFWFIKLMIVKMLTKIPILRSLVKLHAHKIDIVETVEQCEKIAAKFEKSSSYLPILGLDCEWVMQNEIRHPVALLQISDNDGLCSLIRLSKLKTISPSLSKILSDSNIIKVGVAISNDVQFLMNDYNIQVSGYIDLRYLAKECFIQERSLAALAYKLLGFQLDKDWHVRAGNWEAETLNSRQIEYAALDAYVAVKILEQLRNTEISWWNWLFLTDRQKWDEFILKYLEYKDIPYINKTNGNTNFKPKSPSKSNIRLYSTSTIKAAKVYDNCFIENIDGTVMSTCSHKKVDWYIAQDLAVLVNDNPRTIRLNFPAVIKNRKDNFSVLPRENICTVCGRSEHFRKKSIIPKEFVRHMPIAYKSHVPHDTLLLCYWCHIKSNTFDIIIRKKLYDMCQINPIEYPKISTYDKIMRSKSLAKTLLKSHDKLPDKIKYKLKLEIAEIYNIKPERVFNSFLETLLTIKCLRYSNDMQHISPAEMVVNHFLQLDTLSEFKAIWRQHFLDTMKPKYLPLLWSVNYDG